MAKKIVDSNRYMTIATADEHGIPWASPVWYATDDYRTFFWVSKPEARHSRNIAARPRVSVVIFDSQVPVGGAQAMYIEATAEQVTGGDVEQGIGVFSRTSEQQGLHAWTEADVRPPARLRLYRATASEQFVLGPGDQRLAVTMD